MSPWEPELEISSHGGCDIDRDENEMRRRAENDEEMPYLMETELTREEIRRFGDIHDRPEGVDDAADEFPPLYDRTDGKDGYVILEANPYLTGRRCFRGKIEAGFLKRGQDGTNG